MIAKRIESDRQTSSITRLVKYVVNANGGLDPRSWDKTAGYILDENVAPNERGEKVGGVRVTNCGTDDPAAATVIIQSTQAVNVKSKKDKTYHLVFSFPPGENPSVEVLNKIEDELCATIGYADHQRISAIHIDTDHLHVHVAINKVHPTGFQNIEPYFDKKRLMEACEKLEIKYGLERTNHGEIENERTRRHANRIDLGPAQRPEQRNTKFREYLRKSHNLTLAEPPKAETFNGLRNLSGCNMADLAERSKVLLPSDARSNLEQEGAAPFNGVRWPGNGNRTNAKSAELEDKTGIETLAGYVASNIAEDIRAANDWQAVHKALADHGLEIKERGAGLVIGDSGLPLWVKASQCGRDLSIKSLVDRLGPFEAPKGTLPKGSKGAYQPRPLQTHKSTANLFAQYQREKQSHLEARKNGMAQIKQESQAHAVQLKQWAAQQRALLKLSGRGVTRRAMSVTITSQVAAARKKNQQAAQTRREQLYKQTVMPSWADWLAYQANAGNAEALEVLRSREQREAKLQGDLLTAANAEKAKATLLKELKPITRRDGVVSYRTADGGKVLDRKTHVQAEKQTTGAAFVALTLAAEKFTGQPLIVEGTDQFKHEVAHLAALHGIDVVFADPAMESQRKAVQEAKKPSTKEEGKDEPESAEKPSNLVTSWIESRNKTREKISSLDYHRSWEKTDAGKATYQGKRTMKDGSEVLLLKRGNEMLVHPVSSNVAAKATKLRVGQTVQIDARGRLTNTSRDLEL